MLTDKEKQEYADELNKVNDQGNLAVFFSLTPPRVICSEFNNVTKYFWFTSNQNADDGIRVEVEPINYPAKVGRLCLNVLPGTVLLDTGENVFLHAAIENGTATMYRLIESDKKSIEDIWANGCFFELTEDDA